MFGLGFWELLIIFLAVLVFSRIFRAISSRFSFPSLPTELEGGQFSERAGDPEMSRQNAFDATSCFRRGGQAMRRLNEVFDGIADIGRAFQTPPDPKIESVKDVDLRSGFVELREIGLWFLARASEHLLARALAEEGLALIDQIESEVSIFNRSPEISESADLSRAAEVLASIQNTVGSRKSELEKFLEQNEQAIQSAMTRVQQIETAMGELANDAKDLLKRLTRAGRKGS